MTATSLSTWAARLEAIGGAVLRYGLVAILLYYGTFKFTVEEAKAIEPLVANSLLFSWLHGALGMQGISNVIGVAEIVVAVLIATRPFSPEALALGSVLSIVVRAIHLPHSACADLLGDSVMADIPRDHVSCHGLSISSTIRRCGLR